MDVRLNEVLLLAIYPRDIIVIDLFISSKWQYILKQTYIGSGVWKSYVLFSSFVGH